MAKKHWTQTRAGKEKMRQLAKQRHANGKEPARVSKEKDFTAHVAYIFGRTEGVIEVYARSNGIPFATLANGVATLLLRQASGEVLGTEHHLSRVQRSAAE